MRRTAAVGILVALMLVVPVGPAEAVASPLQGRDTITDVRPRKADIKAVRIDNAATLRLTIRTVEGDNPATSPAWQRDNTRITWKIYFGPPARGHDYAAGILAVPGESAIVPVVNRQNQLVCVGSYSVVGGDGIRLSLPRSCITGTARPFRWSVKYEYQRPNGVVSVDKVPDSGVGGVVDPA